MLELIGSIAFAYLFLGAVIVGYRYGEVKDRADSGGIPRWFEYSRQMLMWLPMAVMSNKGK